MDIYTYTDENLKVYSNNQLVVSFNFPSEVETETAIKQIDDLCSLADNNEDIEFESYDIDMYVLSPKPLEEN
tara:strand:- start:504 stop:719 length:216 start_codon:yes stop_codon:yes gene_type:complete